MLHCLLRMYFPVFSALLSAVVVASCGGSDGDSPLDPDTDVDLQLRGTISGTVHDTAGTPLSGVSVTLDTAGYSTVSDTAGRYTIPDVPGGTWSVQFHKLFYRDTTVDSVLIAIDEEIRGLDMVMRPEIDTNTQHILDTLASVAGVVLDSLGVALQGASVSVVGQSPTATTGPSGEFLLADLLPGQAQLQFSKSGYRDTLLAAMLLRARQDTTGFEIRMRALPETTLVQGSLHVGISSGTQVRLRITPDGGDSLPVDGFSWNATTRQFSGSVERAKDSGAVEVLVYDVDGHLTGYSMVRYAPQSALVVVPGFNGGNLLPGVVIAGGDSAAAVVLDTVVLGAYALDTGYHAGIPAGVEWNCSGKSWDASGFGDSLALLVNASMVPGGLCVAKVVDADGNTAYDTLTLVIEPLINAVNFDAGNFQMGSGAANAAVHTVTLTKEFALGTTEVTLNQFVSVLNRERASLTITADWVLSGNDTLTAVTTDSSVLGISYVLWDGSRFSAGRNSYPVSIVTWKGAAFFCNALSRADGRTPVYDETTWSADLSKDGWRLPTEAEWEFAASEGGTSSTLYPGSDVIGDVAWYYGNYDALDPIHPVAEKQSTLQGLYDLAGNVSEWTGDWYEAHSSGSASDPVGAASGTQRVVKGGEYDSRSDISPSPLVPGNRTALEPGSALERLGFRIARTR